MAATTSGWQWPVEVTAMPAEKSKNSLPSTSVTTMPRPLLATRGYERVYEGEMYFVSPASTRFALGPGRAVLIFGPVAADRVAPEAAVFFSAIFFSTTAVMVSVVIISVDMESSVGQQPLVRGQLSFLLQCGHCNSASRGSGSGTRRTE